MWTLLIEVDPPYLWLRLRVGERVELRHTQTLIAQASIGGRGVGVILGFSASCEIELRAAVDGPRLKVLGHELRPVINGDRDRQRTAGGEVLQCRDDVPAGE